MKLKQNIILILILSFFGCETYEERYYDQEYDESDAEIQHSKDHFYSIGGKRQKVKTEDFDVNNILRKELFFRDKIIYRKKLYNEHGALVIEEEYSDFSNLIGVRTYYYDNGNIKEKYNFHGSDFNGKFNSYYERGSLKSDLVYNNNQLSGSCSWYFPNGNIMKIKEFYKNENYQFEFYEDGTLKSEGAFNGSDFTGRWIFYKKNGDIELEKDYF